jgi:hypothetical protein
MAMLHNSQQQVTGRKREPSGRVSDLMHGGNCKVSGTCACDNVHNQEKYARLSN